MSLLLIIFFTICFSEVSTDSLAVLIGESKNELLKEVRYDDPLKGKKGGVEINPVYSLVHSDDAFNFSGSISLFPKDTNIEIAFPFAYKPDYVMEQAKFRLDCQYRYFLGRHRKGIHIMAGVRHAIFEKSDYEFDDNYSVVTENSTESSQGISFGVGYRLFAKSGIYWGASFYMGRYIIGSRVDDIDRFMNLEFFKFGKTF